MNPKDTSASRSSGPQREPTAPRKRFRIDKLEERIAPKKGGKGTNNCSGSVGTSFSGGTSSIY